MYLKQITVLLILILSSSSCSFFRDKAIEEIDDLIESGDTQGAYDATINFIHKYNNDTLAVNNVVNKCLFFLSENNSNLLIGLENTIAPLKIIDDASKCQAILLVGNYYMSSGEISDLRTSNNHFRRFLKDCAKYPEAFGQAKKVLDSNTAFILNYERIQRYSKIIEGSFETGFSRSGSLTGDANALIKGSMLAVSYSIFNPFSPPYYNSAQEEGEISSLTIIPDEGNPGYYALKGLWRANETSSANATMYVMIRNVDGKQTLVLVVKGAFGSTWSHQCYRVLSDSEIQDFVDVFSS